MSKQCLDVHQMQHLQELGLELKKDTILVWARFMLGKTQISDWEIAYNHSVITENSQIIPAYTLQDVLDALPLGITYERYRYLLVIYKYYIRYESDDYHIAVRFGGNNLIDAAYEMLCWLIEQGYVEANKNE